MTSDTFELFSAPNDTPAPARKQAAEQLTLGADDIAYPTITRHGVEPSLFDVPAVEVER